MRRYRSSKIKFWRSILLISWSGWVLLSACDSHSERLRQRQPKPPQPIASNSKCSTVYNPQVDYFPDKVKVTEAKGFTVEYHRNYKVVSVKNPWRNADTTFQYVLVQCNTPIPSGFKNAQIIGSLR